ncbi:DUF2264 domain-containing protein [Kribbella sandramycini]|uniref:DUF2264 domain-containing protein n=1 Tax=Kribbella sandramycini TaxID=60450 RepID=A0A7Y4KZG3_9ACTN|nr:DUF2264 domain-containing protein [Kribbella sandramycini]MBB6569475.1 hypothetical protein [Kribbella sandramycini]NOL40691.1 DUF2264 domain-containing protein [Kribbella sandramycini]
MTRLILPDTDRVLSRQTGWTRAHWEGLADHLLDSLVPYFSPGSALIALPGRPSRSGTASDQLEGFARSFMLAAFRIAGVQGKGCEALIERYARGVANGANPEHPESWLRLTPRSQQMVEAAAIAVALHETREWIWERLDDRAQQHVAEWLGGFIGSTTHDNNWRLFQVVSEQFLASVGAPFSQEDIDGGLDRIEDWYVGDGWYSDGDGQAFDNYIGWAMHLYPGLWARMAAATPGAEYEDRLQVYRERLSLFLEDAVHLVGNDGAPIYQGRSLTYRMAAAAPYWMGALLDATPLSPGQTRRLCSGIARHFVQHGVPDERGLLTLGWYDTFLPTTQAYSGPGSPYWASKGFVGLILPPEHPVWADAEETIPLDEADQVRAMPAPGWIVHASRHAQVVQLVNHGSDKQPLAEPSGVEPEGDAHYNRLAYANHAGPELSDSAPRIDSLISLVAPDGRSSTRGRIRRIGVSGRTASSWHQAWLGSEGPWRIEAASVVHGGWEIRCALVDGPDGALVRSGGFAVAGASLPAATTSEVAASARNDDGLLSAIVGLHGYDEAGIHRGLGANAFGVHSATPYLTAPHRGTPLVLVSAVVLTRDALRPEALAEGIDVAVTGTAVRITLPGGGSEVVTLGG